jgi:hypothetical protein
MFDQISQEKQSTIHVQKNNIYIATSLLPGTCVYTFVFVHVPVTELKRIELKMCLAAIVIKYKVW